MAFAISVPSEIALIASRRRASLHCVDRFCRASLVLDSGFSIGGCAFHHRPELRCRCEGKFTRGHGRDRASDILGPAPAVDEVNPSASSMSKRDLSHFGRRRVNQTGPEPRTRRYRSALGEWQTA